MVKVKQVDFVDYIVIATYFVAVLAVGLWSSCRNRRGGVKGYFLAGKSMTWFLIGGSLYGSNIGTEHFIGLAGSGAINGIAVAGFELQGLFTLVILGWLFLPVYISAGVYTMPEYLKKRFGGRRIHSYLAFLTLFLSIVVKTSVDLFSGSIFIKSVMGWNLYAAIGLQLLIAAISTLGGGLTAVMWTDTMQVILLIIGACVVMIMGFNEVGGYNQMVDKYFAAIPSANATIPGHVACSGLPSSDSMHLFRSINSSYPWTGMTIGVLINSLWYWCCDQVIVQKALAGKTFTHSKGGCLMTGFLKFLPLWMMVFPGMISRILFTDIVACTDPDFCESVCDHRGGCSNIAYPLLVIYILPKGLRGVLIAVMMAAIMSNVTSTFNSCSTIFTMDVWHAVRKKAGQLELLIVGRVFIVLMVITSLAWIPIIEAFPSSQLINYVQSVQSYMGPPVCAIFVLGIFVPRVNENGAFFGLIVGLLVGISRLVLEIAYGPTFCNLPDHRPNILTQIHFLHFGIVLFVLVSFTTIVVSFITETPPQSKIDGLTFWARHEPRHKKPQKFDATLKYTIENGAVDVSMSSFARSTVTGSENSKPTGKFMDMLHRLCGTPEEAIKGDEPASSTVAFPEHAISLKEDVRWKRFCNFTAIGLLTFGVFVYVFWA